MDQCINFTIVIYILLYVWNYTCVCVCLCAVCIVNEIHCLCMVHLTLSMFTFIEFKNSLKSSFKKNIKIYRNFFHKLTCVAQCAITSKYLPYNELSSLFLCYPRVIGWFVCSFGHFLSHIGNLSILGSFSWRKEQNYAAT